jgi:predicted nuclease with TOPRIM domain
VGQWMKPEDKILTYEQARELKFFVKNCTGLRQEFYELFDNLEAFKRKLDRLNNTCGLIEEYFKKHPEADPDLIFAKEKAR